MAGLNDLKKKARRLGMSAAEARGADRDELQNYIADHSNGTSGRMAAKKVVKKASAVKKATTRKATPRKVGRPKGSGNSSKRVTKKQTSGSTGNGHTRSTPGRHVLQNGVDYGKTKGWNPRPGSPPDRIIKSLKAKRGDREKVFQALKSDVWDFTGKKKQDGSKRTLAEAHAMLKYRIARTEWQFALATKQHKVATKRIEYGTGENASVRRKGRRGRPKGSTTKRKPTAKKTTTRKRGRPRTRR